MAGNVDYSKKSVEQASTMKNGTVAQGYVVVIGYVPILKIQMGLGLSSPGFYDRNHDAEVFLRWAVVGESRHQSQMISYLKERFTVILVVAESRAILASICPRSLSFSTR